MTNEECLKNIEAACDKMYEATDEMVQEYLDNVENCINAIKILYICVSVALISLISMLMLFGIVAVLKS